MTSPCCPDAPRIDGKATREGLPIGDLHRHQRMLRGFVAGETQATFWYQNGRISPLAATGRDIEGVG